MKEKDLYIPYVEGDTIKVMVYDDKSFIYGARSSRGNLYRYEALDTKTEPSYSAVWEHLHELDIRQRYWCLSPEQTVIDAGACFGSYTCSALADGAFVYAFEPDSALFEALNRVIELNAWKNVELYKEKANIDKLQLTKLNMIKIDVEGDELQVLKDGMRSIKKFKPTLIVECHISMNKNILLDVIDLVKPFRRLTHIREAVTECDTQHLVIDF